MFYFLLPFDVPLCFKDSVSDSPFISMEPTGVEVECRLEGAVCLVEERGIVHPTMNCDRNKNFPSVKRYHGVTELLV